MKLLILVGSLRRQSIARKIALHVTELVPDGVDCELYNLRDLPLYDFDYDDPSVVDKPTPPEYLAFRAAIKEADAVLFVTSENNRTIPACLKNAVDIGSKPNNDVAWKAKAAGIISHSVGRMGGYSAQKNLRLALSYFDMEFPAQPEVFLGQSHLLIGEDDRIQAGSTIEFVRDYVERLMAIASAKHSA
ncbi:MAG: NADPH-dependent FMN reductase [Corynebacterium casei]|uniref:FMN reductase n=2 Tax=Corynebacterium casei TaxID=160386 RepID=A0ABN4C8Q1_9CORY|nr:NADPH-dependent FMN reductase [Corynebacterium casei]AHI18857.1 FMN reductase [Corynebacterium casei LMG S-19264]MDN5705758.1 NAD(P)H-dependent oxidoreductase [Corynebacterium casei]MDN5728492.1 NAD(P)H-dependent oxidoreductase [Corynebacterium casei]MDN5739929.1 NAD(P)H-dependent oxidoreductase [Corynebacterium casei]MDN5784390.1 NAD(P)H-dependent oxidoreductase [Corynebacterium casei]